MARQLSLLLTLATHSFMELRDFQLNLAKSMLPPVYGKEE